MMCCPVTKTVTSVMSGTKSLRSSSVIYCQGGTEETKCLKMSRHQVGKDTIIFASKEDHEEPCSIELPEPEPQPGLILEDGSINWNCPCLGGMATGPCGVQFREAFSCFHYSTAETKGSDCVDAFSAMQKCMAKYPKLYGSGDDDKEDYGLKDLKEIPDQPTGSTVSTTSVE